MLVWLCVCDWESLQNLTQKRYKKRHSFGRTLFHASCPQFVYFPCEEKTCLCFYSPLSLSSHEFCGRQSKYEAGNFGQRPVSLSLFPLLAFFSFLPLFPVLSIWVGISQEYKRGEKVSLFQVLHFFSILRVFHSLFSLPPSFSCILVNFSALTVILLFSLIQDQEQTQPEQHREESVSFPQGWPKYQKQWGNWIALSLSLQNTLPSKGSWSLSETRQRRVSKWRREVQSEASGDTEKSEASEAEAVLHWRTHWCIECTVYSLLQHNLKSCSSLSCLLAKGKNDEKRERENHAPPFSSVWVFAEEAVTEYFLLVFSVRGKES